jgi:hypothetical protein
MVAAGNLLVSGQPSFMAVSSPAASLFPAAKDGIVMLTIAKSENKKSPSLCREGDAESRLGLLYL